MCYEWEEELAWHEEEEEEEKVPVDVVVNPVEIQEPAVPEAA
jgi:hypothetical protein